MSKNYLPYLSRAGENFAAIGNIVAPANSLLPNTTGSSKTPKIEAVQDVANKVKNKISTSIKSLGTLTTDFGSSTKYEKYHPGVDIANKIGTAVPAYTDGTVVEEVTGKKQGDSGFGNYVVIKDDQGNLHRYSHLNKCYVRVGQKVYAGNQLGEIGNTGQTYSLRGGTGAHLDYRVKDMYNKYVNPYQFLK